MIHDNLLAVTEGDEAGLFYPAAWALGLFFVRLAKAWVLHHFEHLRVHKSV